MIRCAYLIPRLTILGLIVLALWVGSDPLIRRLSVSQLENATGAKVEIGQLRFSFGKQKMFLKQIAMTDPRNPMVNLVQADMAYLELDAESLLRRRFVVENSQTSNVMFGAPRTESGAIGLLPESSRGSDVEDSWEPNRFESLDQIGLHWLDGLAISNHDPDAARHLELVQTIDSLNRYWQQELPAQQNQVLVLKEKTAKLKSTPQNYPTNKLRTNFVNTSQSLDSVTKESQAIQARLHELVRAVAMNREQLIKAHTRDVEKLKQSIHVASFDSDSMSRLLLTKPQEEYVGEVVGWFRWFRQSIPDPKNDFLPKQVRGVEIDLPGTVRRPGFLIKSMDLEGEGRFAGRHMNFAGTAHNLTSQPDRWDQPATFEVRAQGDQHVILTCSIDRRSDQSIDRLEVLCPDLELDSRQLGEKNSMLVTLGPASRIQADVKIQAVDDQITGELVFRHSNVSLHVDSLNELAGGADVALQMNQGLAPIDQFETRVTVTGTFDDYQFDFQSDLGSRFSTAINPLLKENGEHTIAKQRAALDQLLENQLASLDQNILPQLQQLSQLLNKDAVDIASLKKSYSEDRRFPKLR